MTWQEILDQIRTTAGFDVTETVAKLWVQQRYNRMLADSGWREGSVSLGTTVAGTATYAIPAGVVEIDELRVGSLPYARIGTSEYYNLVYYGRDASTWTTNYYALTGDTSGVHSVALYPTPETSGTAITATGPLTAADIGADLTQSPALPSDFHDALVLGGIATGLARVDEKIGEADRYEVLFQNEIEKLRRRRHTRLGSGPVQTKVAGYHF